MDRATKSAIITQYLRVAVLTIVGVLTFESLLPLAWRFGWQTPKLPFSQPFWLVLFTIGMIAALFLAMEPIKIRSGHWRHIHRYPPLVSGLVVSLAVVVFIDGVFPRRAFVSSPTWVDQWSILFLAFIFTAAVALRQMPIRRRELPKRSAPPAELSWSAIENWIKSGERALEPGDVDLFNHRQIADRIVASLLDPLESYSVALVGPYGSGKTGVLNAVRTALELRTNRLVVVADLNAWTIAKPKDAPRLAIERIVVALENYADVQRLRGMPNVYKRLASASPSGWLEKLIGPVAQGDPIGLLDSLAPILDALDAQVVLFIEDAERAGMGKETRHLERLLWALGRTKRVSFVLAYSEPSDADGLP